MANLLTLKSGPPHFESPFEEELGNELIGFSGFLLSRFFSAHWPGRWVQWACVKTAAMPDCIGSKPINEHAYLG